MMSQEDLYEDTIRMADFCVADALAKYLDGAITQVTKAAMSVGAFGLDANLAESEKHPFMVALGKIYEARNGVREYAEKLAPEKAEEKKTC